VSLATLPLFARTWVALVHHPVYDRERRIITTAITNLDIHDLARSSRTFGLAGYHLVTPIAAQRELAARILGHWRATDGGDAPKNDFRRQALAPVAVFPSLAESRAAVAEAAGAAPLVAATTARATDRSLSCRALAADAALDARPLLLLFGTGWGLADEVLDQVDRVLAPIRGAGDYNHLSVRSAAAILLDRLFGDREPSEARVSEANEGRGSVERSETDRDTSEESEGARR
jgi:hypothetical protein